MRSHVKLSQVYIYIDMPKRALLPVLFKHDEIKHEIIDERQTANVVSTYQCLTCVLHLILCEDVRCRLFDLLVCHDTLYHFQFDQG